VERTEVLASPYDHIDRAGNGKSSLLRFENTSTKRNKNGISIMFTGTYIHTIDEKKRLSVPAKFRQLLGKKAVITIGLNKCLSIYTTKDWKGFAKKLVELSMGRPENRALARMFLSSAFDVEIDSIGRILIPDTLKSHATLRSQVYFIGVGDRIEVWDEAAWNAYRAQQDTDRIAEKLGESGVF
jgi:MraZ protein